MNGGGKPELRVLATGEADFEGVVGRQVNLSVGPSQAGANPVRVAAAVYNGVNIPVNESDFSITIAGDRSVLVVVIHAVSEDQAVNLVERDSAGNEHVLSTFQYHYDNPTALYTIRGILP
jgi:hypothetical protein